MAKEDKSGGFQDLDKRLMSTYSEWHVFLMARKKELETYLSQGIPEQEQSAALSVEVEVEVRES